eukprot:8954786-Karenia_brevis.AAC.1
MRLRKSAEKPLSCKMLGLSRPANATNQRVARPLEIQSSRSLQCSLFWCSLAPQFCGSESVAEKCLENMAAGDVDRWRELFPLPLLTSPGALRSK